MTDQTDTNKGGEVTPSSLTSPPQPPNVEDKTEVIAWTIPWRPKDARASIGAERSKPDGVFPYASATTTYQLEEPAVNVNYSDQLPLKYVRRATPYQRDAYDLAVKKLAEAQFDLKVIESLIAKEGDLITWDWILAHGSRSQPNSEQRYIPEPFKSKHALANLRKGSRVVIGVVSTRYAHIGSKVGKVIKKERKDVLVEFGNIRTHVPYPDLKRADQVSKEQRKENAESAKSMQKMAGELSKLFH